MNIAIVSEGFERRSLLLQPWHRIYDISKRIARRDGLSVFIISDKTGNLPYSEDIEGIIVTRIDRFKLPSFLRKKSLERVLCENNADIIIWCGTPLSAVHLNQLKSLGRPVVWDIDMDVQHFKNLNRLSFRELLDPGHNFLLPQLLAMICSKFLVKRVANSGLVSRIVVPSQSLKNSLGKIGVNPNKINVISSAIEKTDFNILDAEEKNQLRSALGFEQADFIITYFGSPCTIRGPDKAVLSMKKILDANKNVKLVILSRRKINDPSVVEHHLKSEEEYLKRLIKKIGVESNVQIIPGIMSKSKLRSYLLMSDAIVLPFKHVFSEPPLSVLEAMSLGKTVVTTNLGTLSEIVGKERGILVEPNNESALAQAIVYLAGHPEQLACIGKNAQRFVAGLADWNQVALNFEELLNKTLKERG